LPEERADLLNMHNPKTFHRIARFNLRLFLACGLSVFTLLIGPFNAFAEDIVPSKELSLTECIELSLTSSPDVLAAQERIEQARAAVQQAQSGFYPRFSVGETFVRSDFAPLVFSNQLAQGELSGDFPAMPPPGFDPFAQFNDPGPLSNWSTQFLLQWPVFQGGKTFYGNRAAIASLSAAELELQAVHNNLAYAVSNAYYQILKTESSIRIAEQSAAQIQSHLDIARARYEGEIALKSDVLRVTVRLAEAQEALAIARHNLDRAKSRLNLALGLPVNQPLALTNDRPLLLPPTDADQTLAELTELARLQRPEIERMNNSIASLENAVNAARAGHYPQLNAFAHYDIDSEDFSDSNESWTVGLSANISIFDGFLTRSAVSSARARLREAEAQKEQTILQVEMDVKNAFLGRSEAATRLQVLQQAVAEAEESVRILSERYAEGMALTTELLDAEVALTNARLHELSAKYDYLIASAALERAVGAIIDEGSGQ